MRCRRGEGATGCACCRVLMFSVVLPHMLHRLECMARAGLCVGSHLRLVSYPERCVHVRCTPMLGALLSVDVEEKKAPVLSQSRRNILVGCERRGLLCVG